MQNCCISFDFTRYLEPKFLSYDHPLGSLSPLLSSFSFTSDDSKPTDEDKLTVWTKISEAASRKSPTSFPVEHVSSNDFFPGSLVEQ